MEHNRYMILNESEIYAISLPYVQTVKKIFFFYVKLIERTNKMQPCSRIYYSNVS
jgi:hypothetical protein